MIKHNLKVVLCLALATPAWAKSPATLIIRLSPADCKITAKTVTDGQIPEPAAIAKDAYCVRQMMDAYAPKGAVTIFGSARLPEDHEVYKFTREFAYKWTLKMGRQFPVLTGGGRGIMEAGNRGASDAKGESLSISTWFTGGLERPNHYTTHGYMAASFSQRETDLIDYAAAVVVAPGGFGTEWEIYETLSKIQTKKKNAVPVIMLGGKKYWTHFMARVEDMKTLGTINPEDVKLFFVAETTDEAVAYLEKAMPSKPSKG